MRTLTFVVCLIVGTAAAADARQPADAFADLWRYVRSGDSVFVTDAGGQETAGVFAKVSDTTLSILVNGQLRDLPTADIREIAKRGDSLRNGFIIGAAFGTVVGASLVAECDDRFEDCLSAPGLIVTSGLFYGGIGAAIDHFIRGRTVVFRVKASTVHLRPQFSIDRSGARVLLALSVR